MTDHHCKCGGDGWIVVEHGDVAVSEICPVCGPIIEAISANFHALRPAQEYPAGKTLRDFIMEPHTGKVDQSFGRYKALFDVAVERCEHAIQEAAA
jgi:hypothetical protein